MKRYMLRYMHQMHQLLYSLNPKRVQVANKLIYISISSINIFPKIWWGLCPFGFCPYGYVLSEICHMRVLSASHALWLFPHYCKSHCLHSLVVTDHWYNKKRPSSKHYVNFLEYHDFFMRQTCSPPTPPPTIIVGT